MAKFSNPFVERESERDMRDRMNDIRRDENGKMTHIHGKPIVKKDEPVSE